MNVTVDQLLAIIGGKDVDLFLLRQENAELRKRLSEAEEKLAEKGDERQALSPGNGSSL